MRSLNLCDPKDLNKLLDAIKDFGLAGIGVVGGPIAGAVAGGYQIYNDAGKETGWASVWTWGDYSRRGNRDHHHRRRAQAFTTTWPIPRRM